ncbi:MAG: hypothetical protein V3U76_19640 [Granulosicoccus sp.]
MTDPEKELECLEEGMWRSNTRFDEHWMRRHLHPEFLEFGQSGQIYCFESILELPYEAIDCEFPLANFSLTWLSESAILLTYDAHIRRKSTTSRSH